MLFMHFMVQASDLSPHTQRLMFIAKARRAQGEHPSVLSSEPAVLSVLCVSARGLLIRMADE